MGGPAVENELCFGMFIVQQISRIDTLTKALHITFNFNIQKLYRYVVSESCYMPQKLCSITFNF